MYCFYIRQQNTINLFLLIQGTIEVNETVAIGFTLHRTGELVLDQIPTSDPPVSSSSSNWGSDGGSDNGYGSSSD